MRAKLGRVVLLGFSMRPARCLFDAAKSIIDWPTGYSVQLLAESPSHSYLLKHLTSFYFLITHAVVVCSLEIDR
jgi:hypothetical protein